MTFNEWLVQQTDRDDNVGELARFARDDDRWPSDPRVRMSSLRTYLFIRLKVCCSNHIDFFEHALVVARCAWLAERAVA
jgi:hypothetical protein